MAPRASHPMSTTGAGSRRLLLAHCPGVPWADVGPGCSGWDLGSCRKHCVVFALTLFGTYLCEGNRALKAELGELIFLGMKFPRETFRLLVFPKAVPG